MAIILSGTGSEREYVQRLGRILRKGTQGDKLAVLYEVVAEDTSEERTSQRRRGAVSKPKPKGRQLELIPSASLKAAESSTEWRVEE